MRIPCTLPLDPPLGKYLASKLRSDAVSLYSSYILGFSTRFYLIPPLCLNVATIYAVKKTLSLSRPLKILPLKLACPDLGVGLLCSLF